MKRREFLAGSAASLIASVIDGKSSVFAKENGTQRNESPQAPSAAGRRQIAMLVYPGFAALDLVGPHQFVAGLMEADVHLVWKNKDAIATGPGNLSILPTATFEECPPDLDLLFVPGGLEGTIAVMRDEKVLSFLSERGARAKYVTSVCTGSLVLGAAGLLRGYRATSHWAFKDLLPLVDAIPAPGRVVEDRNRITGAGVTSGIDFGLTVSARMSGAEAAEMLQLLNEYDPDPPFDAGTPAKAGPQTTSQLRNLLAAGIANTRAAAMAAGKRLRSS
ncbi:MAG: DJ-1/PfpI family protein [Deltaproteobacteria bacterium]|nr:DJ-1/PfpI family protein [Deltaproteobacteria bacterium]